VHIALARRGRDTADREEHFGPAGRGAIRVKSLEAMLNMLEESLERE
jgi:nicotinamide-nucleotide amidase